MRNYGNCGQQPIGGVLIQSASGNASWVLSAEFLIKTGYGALISWGNETTYGAADMEIYALVTGVTDEILAAFPDVHLIERIDREQALITIPHYQPFTDLVPALTKAGVHFVEFAGNGQIMLSAFAPNEWSGELASAKVMFTMDALVQPGYQRIGLNIPVARAPRRTG